MSAVIIEGNKIAKRIREELKERLEAIKEEKGIQLGLVGVIVGGDPASLAYIKNKEKVCNEVGMTSITYELPSETTEEELVNLIEELNKREDVHGILVQLPLPKHINQDRIAETISPKKDVDCFNPINQGRFYRGEKAIPPCTPKGIMRLIKETGIELKGKSVSVIGRSNIVGKPAAFMLLSKDATVTICHSKTPDLKEVLIKSDIIVSAVGRPGLVKADMVKEGAVVIDAGTSYKDNKLVGDVDFENVAEVASYITPVPRGVGAMTTTMLIENVLEASGYNE